jgi:plastocyanin
MRRLIALSTVLAAAVLLGLGFQGGRGGIRPAQAAQTWEVAVPAGIAEESIGLDAFFPSALAIQAGDSVRWTIEGGHTVTFLGARGRVPDLPQFVPGGPYPDGRVAGAGFLPIGPEGLYDGDEVRSSGRSASRVDDTYTLTFPASGFYPYL